MGCFKVTNLFAVGWLLLLILAATPPALAQNRHALIIGNSAYQHTAPLANPASDARLIAQALKLAGFKVRLHIDRGQKHMKRAIRDFSRSLRKAGANGVGLIYYAGHGTQVDGRNYLVPVDAQIEHEGDVAIETLLVDNLLAQMETAKVGLNILILDACRNNPYKRGYRSAVRGLAPVKAVKGTLVAYSTAPGTVAQDGDGDNSPYAVALNKYLRTPGLSIENMFKKIRVEVDRMTRGKQTPWEESSLFGDFMFRSGAQSSNRPRPSGRNPQSHSETQLAAETAFWNTVKDSDNPSAIQSYLSTFPRGLFAALAKWKIDELKNRKQADLNSLQKQKLANLRTNSIGHQVRPPPKRNGQDCLENYRTDGTDTYCVSSVLRAQSNNYYGIASLLDDSNYTAWFEAARHQGVGEWITVDFGEMRAVKQLRLKNGYNKRKDLYYKNGRIRQLELLFSNGQKSTANLKDEPGLQVINLRNAPASRWLQLKIKSVYRGSKYNDTGLNELRVVSAPINN